MIALPIYKIKGKFYFLDKRLNEYRNIKNPSDRLNFNDVSLKDLEKPTDKDKNIFYTDERGLKNNGTNTRIKQRNI